MTGLRDLIASTLWIDTHEHLLEEKVRLMEPGTLRHPCQDWALLYWHYVRDDLAASGMPAERLRDFYGSDLNPVEKWILVEPYLKRIATSTYVRAADFSCRRLYGQVPSRETVESITSSMASMRQAGFYERVLKDEAGVELCHVNSREHTFVVSDQPHLLKQDIGIGDFIITERERIPEWEAATGLEVGSLDGLMGVIDAYFDRFAKLAVAVKLDIAGKHGLAIDPVRSRDAVRTFGRWLSGADVSTAERQSLEDAIATRCLDRARDHRLPIKVHTGYLSGHSWLNLHRMRDNLPDLVSTIQRYDGANFVLMHIGYPYTGEVIALAKHYPNVVADLCWAWLIDPVETRSFVRRFLVAAPANKLLCFGGDYLTVENVVGHADIARQGLGDALESLIDEGFLNEAEAHDLVPTLMRTNAIGIFGGEQDENAKRPVNRDLA